MPVVKIPTVFRGPTQGKDRVEVEGATVRQCLEAVSAEFDFFRDQIFDADDKIHRFVQLFVNGEEIDRGDLDLAVSAGDEVDIVAAVAGG